jgi:hypothetical protein
MNQAMVHVEDEQGFCQLKKTHARSYSVKSGRLARG